MKIVLLDTFFKYGTAGANRQIGYAKGFKHYGYDVEIVSFCVFDKGDYVGEPGISVFGLKSANFNGNKLFRAIYTVFTLFRFLITHIKKTDVLMVCGCEDWFPIIHMLKRDKIFYECTESPIIVGPKLLPMRWYLSYCKRFNKIFVISNNLKNWFVTRGIKFESIHIVNMFVDKTRFKNVTEEQHEHYLAYCGTVSDKKDGVDKLIEVFAQYHLKFPNRKLYIIGPIYSDAQKKKYEDLIKELSLIDSVVFTGQISPDKMPGLLSGAEMLLLIRPNNEQAYYGFPTKLGEYLLTSKPVLMTNVGNVSDFLEDKVSALLPDATNHKQIINSMIWVSEHETEAKIIGMKGKEVAINYFDNIAETAKVITYFQGI